MRAVLYQESIAVQEAVRRANCVLPGIGEHDESRWPAVIAVSEYIETNPEEFWDFVVKWCSHADKDLRDAVSCCVLEHLLEYHFELVFPRS